MNQYDRRTPWRLALIVTGLIVLLITVLYSNHLAKELSKSEQKNLELYLQSVEFLANNTEIEGDVALQAKIVSSFNLPVITRDENGNVEGYNWSEERNKDEAFLNRKIAQFEKSGKDVIKSGGYLNEVFYFETPLYKQITFFPIVQGLLITFYVVLAYFFFSSNRRAEQNLVWAGMAKETAHQLGTPISAIMAWIQYLKEVDPAEDNSIDVVKELEADVNRLELIADRFSKIGSVPELEPTDIYVQLDDIKEYMIRRAPRKIKFIFPEATSPLIVNINRHLFSWVLENLIRNALDSMDGEGTIKAELHNAGNMIHLDLSDTGHGIPSNKFKTIFKPGYSTKQRGWGLGLSLAKRIIEEYHKGRIFVKISKINEGTTFSIHLPIAK